MNQYAEKRDFYRMAVNSPATIRLHGSNEVITSVVKNLSSSGFLFEIEHDIPAGTQLEVEIKPQNDITPPLLAEAHVVRCDSQSSGGYHIACGIDRILATDEAASF